MNLQATTQFESSFAASLPLPAGLDPHLARAIRHVLDNPGSLIRPQITFRISLAYGLEEPAARDLAIALEYFHTASLLFDDMPAMDDAAERRGAPCVHTLFGEATATLAALALINRAYALLWSSAATCRPAAQTAALQYVETRLGVGGLLNGQSLDLQYDLLPHDRETTERIARGKTVSLIRLALVLPAMLGDAPADEVQLLERIALFWGLSYQIVDDLKDLLQETAETGKTGARDASLGRPNIALAIGIPSAIRRLERLLAFGDRSLQRVQTRRPALAFLTVLRGNLDQDVEAILQSACEPSHQGAA